MPPPGDPFQLIGSTIAGKYRPDRVLGEGGFGVVYAGMHLALEEPVAIKCLKLDAFPGENQAVQGFLREARVLFQLTHPNIVRMYDVGTVATPAGDIPYVVLELLQGVSLEQEIDRRARGQAAPFSAAEILTIFEGVLEGLSFAHGKGVAHRDLKPSNVMLVQGENGRLAAKLLDFGTARHANKLTSMGGAAAQATGAMGFTPRYAAPEQWDPQVGTTGPGSDIFALGLMLAEVCTLAPALPGDTPGEILALVMNPDRQTIVSARRYDLPRDIDGVVHRATRVAPPQRFASAKEMLESLRRTLGGRGGVASVSAISGIGSMPGTSSPGAPAYGPPPMAPMGPAVTTGPYGAPPIAPGYPLATLPSTAADPAYGARWGYPRIMPKVPRPTGAGWGCFWAIMVVVLLGLIGSCAFCVAVANESNSQQQSGGGSGTTGAANPANTAVATATAGTRKARPVANLGPGPVAALEHVTGAPGQDEAVLTDAIDEHADDLTGCYRKAVAADPKVDGRLEVTVTLKDSGGFDHASCLGTVGKTCACLTDKMKDWQFPAANGKSPTLSFILNCHL